MIALVAVLPGLGHALLHDEPAVLHERRRAVLQSLSGAQRAGLIIDGAWACYREVAVALEDALRAAAAGASIAAHPLGACVGEPPMGIGMEWASRGARSVRAGELVMPTALAAELSLPAGIALLAAPDALSSKLGSISLVRDYRQV